MADTLEGLGTQYELSALARDVGEGIVQDMVREDDKDIFEHDWQKDEPHTCPMCKGTGKNMKFLQDPYCYNCDGKGVEWIMHFGVKNKEFFLYSTEYGIEAKKEYCKAMREAYEEKKKAGKLSELSMIKPFALPRTIEMNLKAMGYPMEDLKNAGQIKEIANIVAEHYEEFLCVPHKRF